MKYVVFCFMCLFSFSIFAAPANFASLTQEIEVLCKEKGDHNLKRAMHLLAQFKKQPGIRVGLLSSLWTEHVKCLLESKSVANQKDGLRLVVEARKIGDIEEDLRELYGATLSRLIKERKLRPRQVEAFLDADIVWRDKPQTLMIGSAVLHVNTVGNPRYGPKSVSYFFNALKLAGIAWKPGAVNQATRKRVIATLSVPQFTWSQKQDSIAITPPKISEKEPYYFWDATLVQLATELKKWWQNPSKASCCNLFHLRARLMRQSYRDIERTGQQVFRDLYDGKLLSRSYLHLMRETLATLERRFRLPMRYELLVGVRTTIDMRRSLARAHAFMGIMYEAYGFRARAHRSFARARKLYRLVDHARFVHFYYKLVDDLVAWLPFQSRTIREMREIVRGFKRYPPTRIHVAFYTRQGGRIPKVHLVSSKHPAAGLFVRAANAFFKMFTYAQYDKHRKNSTRLPPGKYVLQRGIQKYPFTVTKRGAKLSIVVDENGRFSFNAK